ncbi:Protein of unknown function DUF4586 [Phytophthora cactorum]|nr:Protein of unknown function DUF4586 [Phytophthora cactorum]
MYSTKVLNKNIAQSYLTIGDPYRDPHLIESKNSRHKGKQILTVPAKNTCNGSGYFEKKSYVGSAPGQHSVPQVAADGCAQVWFRLQGCKSTRRFMSHIRTEQYRETLHTEMKILDKQKQNDPPGLFDALDSLNQSHHFPEGLQETKHLYDIGRSQTTEFNQNTQRNNGPFMLTSEAIGLGADDVTGNRPTPKGASTRQFYDHSHLHT